MNFFSAKNVLAVALCLLVVSGCGGQVREEDPGVRSDGTTVRVSLDDIGGKRGEFFTYTAPDGGRTDFIVYRESTETFRAVLDACRKCYRWRKGYVIDGDYAVCRRCGERYGLDNLEEGRGSCIPIPLTSGRDGNTLVIPVAELEAGARYF